MATSDKKLTNQLLRAGIVAGPFFVLSSFVHGFMRPGFDMVRHPASLLSVGDLGWIQIGTFVITGILYAVTAVGLRDILRSGIGSRFVAPLFVLVGLAFISGGVFTADPSLGFPPGTPMGVPSQMSWHAQVHGLAPIVGFLALFIAMIALARRFGALKQNGWMWTTISIGIITWVLSSISSFTGNWETGEFNFVPLWVGVALGYGYTSILLYKLKKQ